MMSRSRFFLGAGLGAVALALTGATYAAPVGPPTCLTGVSSPVVNNDDCTQAGESGYIDPNGGCNFTPSQLQSLGVLAAPSTTNIIGTTGTFVPFGGVTGNTSRDLDWYPFTLSEGAVVTITVRMNNSAGEGGVVGFDFSQCFLVDGGTCPAGTTIYGANGDSCAHTMGPFTLPPGDYTFIVTVPFETDALVPFYSCPAAYEAVISVTPTNFGAVCAASTESCVTEHAAGGCNDFACCETVCSFDSDCCLVAWDAECVTSAVDNCGFFVYSCPNPGTPLNDCATAAILVEPGDSVTADTTGSTTDGPNPPSGFCAEFIGRDIWYLMKAPADGELSVNACAMTSTTGAKNFDGMIAVYDVGTDANFNPETLGSVPSACADDTCGIAPGGPTQITIINAIADHYYAVRIGGWEASAGQADTGSGEVTFGFDSVIFNTGPQKFVQSLTGGANTNLGLSAGNVSATLTKRWGAVPFTVPNSDNDAIYKVTQIIAKGFVPPASTPPYTDGTVANLGWVLWKRLPGNPAPTDADQVAAGVVPLPVAFDEADDDSANAAYPIEIADGPVLPPGDYYLTVYGDNGGPTVPANWAWFIYANNGIQLTEGGIHGWRSQVIGGPFLFYNTLGAQWAVQTGDNPDALYTNAFRILGTRIECPRADLNNSGCVDGLDIAIVLGNWDPTGSLGAGYGVGDANCDGIVDGLDIAIVLGGWTGCP